MKKIWIVAMLMLFLCGCGAQETFETLGQVQQPVQADPWQILLELPEDAGSPVMQSQDSGKLYMCKDFSMTIQTLPGGDLNQTFLQCTGFPVSGLQIMQTKIDGIKRYETVWASSAEEGERLGRIAVLDDGSYHYVLTVMADAQKAGQLTDTWQTLFRTLRIEDPKNIVNSGS